MLDCPYIWFGGKRKVASLIWDALGNVDNYVEPFFGGGAVLLVRPHADPPCETVNDLDGFLCNFWRAVQAQPEAVAELVNWPVNEVDLEARHRWLCAQPAKDEFLDRMKHESGFFDVQRAAWWVWGLNAWIGRGWCGGNYYPEDPAASDGTGVCDGANKLPHLGASGKGVHRQCPHLGDGVHRQLPHLGDRGKGECARRLAVLVDWFSALRDRFRNVRVCCGDWQRVVTDGATAYGTVKGVFLDPPYSSETNRYNSVYRCEDLDIAHAVRDWCLEYGPKKFMRIILCGYEGEHDELERHGWRVQAWKTGGGYANFAEDDEETGTSQGKVNRGRERIWFSPHCLNPQPNLL